MKTVIQNSHNRVSPMFNGTAVLPRLSGWSELRGHLPATVELGEGFYDLPLAGQYLRQMSALRLPAEGAAVRVEPARGGLTATVLLRSPLRSIEDRWEIEVDSNGVLTGFKSEHHIGEGVYAAGPFSRFFDAILGGV